MKIKVKVFIDTKHWRIEDILIPDSMAAGLEGEIDEDWGVGLNPYDEIYEWLYDYFRDRIGSAGHWGDGKKDNPPRMFRILAL